jgi:hypothetical protein
MYQTERIGDCIHVLRGAEKQFLGMMVKEGVHGWMEGGHYVMRNRWTGRWTVSVPRDGTIGVATCPAEGLVMVARYTEARDEV